MIMPPAEDEESKIESPKADAPENTKKRTWPDGARRVFRKAFDIQEGAENIKTIARFEQLENGTSPAKALEHAEHMSKVGQKVGWEAHVIEKAPRIDELTKPLNPAHDREIRRLERARAKGEDRLATLKAIKDTVGKKQRNTRRTGEEPVGPPGKEDDEELPNPRREAA